MFGYTQEDLRLVIAPMARNAVESLGSMGTDTPVPVISDRPRMLYEYFKQLFAQVTNPPLDANFEALVTSLNSTIGPEGNVLAPGPDSCRQIVCPSPILTNEELAKLRYIDDGEMRRHRLPAGRRLHALRGRGGRRRSAHGDRQRAHAGERRDRRRREHRDPLGPLRRRRERADPRAARDRARCTTTSCARRRAHASASSIETGEAREVHHFALLLGYGAGAINPYLAFDTHPRPAAAKACCRASPSARPSRTT